MNEILHDISTNGIVYISKDYKNVSCDRYSPHTHSMFELLYIIDADATHVIEEKKYKLRIGDLIFIRPFHHHFIQIDSPSSYRRINILFDADEIGFDTSRISNKLNVINLNDIPELCGVFEKLERYVTLFSEEDFVRLLKGTLFEMLCILSRIDPEDHFSSASGPLTNAIKYINKNLFTIKDVEEIASAVFVTESYLFKLFKRELHKGPKKYLNEKRMLAAQKMISEGTKPTDAATLCGFCDYTSFYRGYVKLFGHAPSYEQKD